MHLPKVLNPNIDRAPRQVLPVNHDTMQHTQPSRLGQAQVGPLAPRPPYRCGYHHRLEASAWIVV